MCTGVGGGGGGNLGDGSDASPYLAFDARRIREKCAMSIIIMDITIETMTYLDDCHRDDDCHADQDGGSDQQLHDGNDGDADDDGDEIGVRPNIVLEASAILGRVCQPVSSSRPVLTMLCS